MPIKSGFKAVSELKNLAIKAPPLFLGGGGDSVVGHFQDLCLTQQNVHI